jgi:hypothetical protein
MKGETYHGKQMCIRGLESVICHDGRDAKIDGWDSVFNEQFTQRRTGNFDDEYMREMYQRSSRQSSQVAHQLGKQDEKEVQKCPAGVKKKVERNYAAMHRNRKA